MPIDQMMVTVTRPIEEAVNSVPGLQNVRSITSRGSAEIDLFFRLERRHVPDAAIRERRDLAGAARTSATAKIEAHRMTFASFPDHRLQPDLGHDAADQAVGDGDL